MSEISVYLKSVTDRIIHPDYSLSFLTADRDWQNYESDEMDFPAVFLDMPLRYAPIKTITGHREREYIITLFVFFESQLDNLPGEEEDLFDKASWIIDKMIDIIDSDTGDVVKSYTFGEVSQVDFQFDRVVSGATITMRLVLLNNNSVCV